MATKRREPRQGGRQDGRGGQSGGRGSRGRDTDGRGRDDESRGGISNPYVRYKKLNRPPLVDPTTSLWTYPSSQYGKGGQGDQSYRGATPSWVIHHVLSRWTNPGDTVLDPFCGSGTTIDVCNDLGRTGIGFDISPVRDDVGAADARSLPLDDFSVDHAFFDPPYADNLTYSDDEACIGKTRADDGSWHQAMAQVAAEMDRVVKPGGIVAAYLSDIMKPDGFYPLGLELAMLMGETMVFRDHICVVRNNQKLSDPAAQKKTRDQLVRGFLHLLIFQRPEGPGPRRSPPKKRKKGRSPGRGASKTRRTSGESNVHSRGPGPNQRAKPTSGGSSPGAAADRSSRSDWPKKPRR